MMKIEELGSVGSNIDTGRVIGCVKSAFKKATKKSTVEANLITSLEERRGHRAFHCATKHHAAKLI
jgi:hypothetical protein